MGWNSESGPFTVTINLGKPVPVGSVKLITHSDQMAGINWPNDVSATVGTSCAPQNTGIPGQSCQPAATSGQATLSSSPVTGGADASDTAGTITAPVTANGQYVTISGVCNGYCLFDEMQVLNTAGTVISTGDTYTVTPQPTNGPGGGTLYGDASNVWQTGTAVTPSTSCGPSPCARLTLPSGAQVTGIKATFPGGGSSADWYFTSQLSTQ